MKKTSRRSIRLVGRLIAVLLVVALGVHWLPTKAQSSVVINYTDPKGTISFKAGESYELKGSEYTNSASQQKIAAITKDSLSLQNQHIIGFGSTALWTDPTERDPDNWNWTSLDAKINTMRLASGTGEAEIMLTLGMAPAWMTTHQAKTSPSYTAYEDWTDYPGASSSSPNTKYSANPAADDDSITEDTINASVDPWFEDDFAYMAAAVAERYPDIKNFQVWNEMKGYYLSGPNHWDYEQYTSLYNKVYAAVKAVRPSAKLGGPYVVMSTWSSAGAASHPATNPACQGSWGVFDQRDIDVIDYWLEHKTGADYIVIDGSTNNRDSNPGFQEFKTKQRTDDLRACLNTVITAAPDQLLPLGIAEYYPKAGSGTMTQARAAAITANALGDTIDNKFGYVLLWDLMAKSCDPLESASLIALSSSVNPDDPPNTEGCDDPDLQGKPSALAPVLEGIKARFSSGTLYAPDFDETKLGVFASSNGIMVVNKQNAPDTVVINGCAPISLTAYEVKFLDLIDCVSPSTPGNFTAEVEEGVVINLSWQASTDSTSTLMNYRLYRNNSLIATLSPNQLSYTETYIGDGPATLSYRIEAVDSFNNVSTQSQNVSVEVTPPQDVEPEPEPEPEPQPEPEPDQQLSDSITDDDFVPGNAITGEKSNGLPSSPSSGIAPRNILTAWVTGAAGVLALGAGLLAARRHKR